MHLVMFVKVFEETLLRRCRYVNLVRKDESGRKREQRNTEEGKPGGQLSLGHLDWDSED